MKHLLFLVLLASSLYVSAQTTYEGTLGYGVSPEGHTLDFSQFGVFLQETANTCNGGVVLANGEWRNSMTQSGIIPNLHKTISLLQPSPYNYIDMLSFAWRSGDSVLLEVPGNSINNWTNTTMKTLFMNMLINAADSLQPTYMFIGNETSRYWELNPIDYPNWVDFYHQAYDSIKVHSPNTKVGTIFNYEHLSGQGELTGFMTSHWQAYDLHDTSKMDVVGLTVYPFFYDTLVSDMPQTYLDSIFLRIGNKPLVITETGWPGDSFVGGWNSSPAQQNDYVDALFDIIDGHNVEAVNWLFLNYLMDTTNTAAEKIFRSVALRDSLGNDRPALNRWLSHCPGSIDINEQSTTKTIHFYPNPANDRLFFKSGHEFTRFYIFDLNGKEILNGPRTSSVSIQGLESGLYLLRIDLGDGSFVNSKLLIE